MGRAVTALEAVKTGSALPPEMQALNALLEAQALVKKRQISRQQSAQGGPGNNNRNYDVSTLFDRELQRLQQTNYETRQSSDAKRADDDVAEKIKRLAQRQDELLRRQEELARQQLGEDEKQRQLEKLTREQAELRQQAEEMARQMSKLQGGQSRESGPPAKAQPGADQTSRQLQEIADDMRSATGDLRRMDSAGGRARGNEALEKLKSLERRLRGGEQERRTLGDLQLEARQLAEAQRQIASSLPQSPDAGAANTDRLRQLAGEQERLAERARAPAGQRQTEPVDGSRERACRPPPGGADAAVGGGAAKRRPESAGSGSETRGRSRGADRPRSRQGCRRASGGRECERPRFGAAVQRAGASQGAAREAGRDHARASEARNERPTKSAAR